MKRLSTIMTCLLAMMAASMSAKAQEVTITLFPGWNWISYPKAETQDISTALGDFEPVNGDMLKSQFGNAVYSNGYWRGSVTHFIPGWGYKYYSNRTEVVSFVFGAAAPQLTVTTAEPTEITMNSATCGGNVISSDGNYVFVLLKGICWGTNPNPTFNDNYIEAGNGLGSFTVSLSDLTFGARYYVRAFAVTTMGTFYGEEIGFRPDHSYVDLGLPSGLLWASCNIGADSPEDYGDYFAWGETQPKSVYSTDSYTQTKYNENDGLSILQPIDDAATANWGGGWHIPSLEEWQELIQYTTSIWTTQNGVYGRLFTASNGNTLFLPAAGYRNNSELYSAGGAGAYWINSLEQFDNIPLNARYFCFDSDYIFANSGLVWGFRYFGQTIRAVRMAPKGSINSLFSVSDSTSVCFSQGNLQYQASTNTWRFAENQWDYVGTQTPDHYGNVGGMVSGSDNCNISQSYDGWIDLFGWGTSGYNHGANCYQPWSTSVNYSDYYAYGNYQFSLFDQTGQADWGYNPIINGGNTVNQWRTLTREEWAYVFYHRTTVSGIRYAKANVNGVNGVILLPDNWETSTYSLSNTNYNSISFSSNIISASQWRTLENAGAVFLPAAGNREGTSVEDVGSTGGYWSATYYNYKSHVCCIGFFEANLFADNLMSDRYCGNSVRLVHNDE